MRYSIAALALAGAAAAMPSRIARDQVVNDVEVVQDVQWVTDVVTVTGGPPAPSPDPVVVAPSPAQATTLVTVVTEAAAAPAPAPPAPAAASPAAASPAAASPALAAGSPAAHNQVAAPAAPAAPAPAAPAPPASSPATPDASVSGNNSPLTSDQMLAVANEWRSKYNLDPFTWSTELAGNSAKTGKDDGGSQEKHELNSISMAQVITPGAPTCGDGHNCAGLSNAFELAYLAGWLCEAPQSALTNCSTLAKASNLDLSSGETGHADILNSKAYKQIGCSYSGNQTAQLTDAFPGLWICDLA